jgi:hypothetical protein
MAMTGMDPAVTVAENYRRFAVQAARGVSVRYEELALAVAADATVLEFLVTLPRIKRQPNLLFAAARLIVGAVPTIDDVRRLAREGEPLRSTMLSRRTQTNEPGRCATLLPALAQLDEPVALIEVGASAGLTLVPDRYGYDYGGHLVAGPTPDAPVMSCTPRGPVPLPEAVPDIVWRAGLDLHPLDVTDPGDVEWLRCLIWPGDSGRVRRLDAAVAAARNDPPRIVEGDLRTDLPKLAAQAPREATLVVFHTAVLAYVDEKSRRGFADTVRDLDAVWLSNEAPGVLPWLDVPDGPGDCFALVRDGERLLGFTEGHGRWVQWVEQRA